MKGLCSRIGNRKNPGHHSWISRDYLDIDCKAVGCMFNREEKCAAPSQARISDDGKCLGFLAKPVRKVEGD